MIKGFQICNPDHFFNNIYEPVCFYRYLFVILQLNKEQVYE